MKISLKNKIFLALVFISFIPTITFLIFNIFFIKNSRLNDVKNIELSLIKEKKERINSFLNDILNSLEIVIGQDAQFLPYSKIPYLRPYDFSSETFLLKEIININPSILEISFIDLAGNEKIKFFREGNNISQASENELNNFSKIEVFNIAKNGSRYISKTYYTLTGPMINVFQPVKSRDNYTVAVIFVKLSLNEIVKIIEEAKLGETGYIYLLDENNFILANSKKEKILGKFDNLRELFNRFPDRLQNYINFNKDVFAFSDLVEFNNWLLVVEWPSGEANKIIYQGAYLIVFITLIIFLLILLIGFIITSQIIKPIEILKTGAKKVGEGKLEKIQEIKTNDEIEELLKEFNLMIDGLIQLQKLKDEFVFIAAHELKAPVGIIKGYISLILEGLAGQIDEKAKETLKKIKDSNERLIQLVHDLLEISRAEAGAIKINVKPTDVSEIIFSVVDELKKMAEEKNIAINYEKMENLPMILVDPDRFREILVNLITNAIKYNYQNGKVFIYHEIKDNNLITYVKDTGFGIPKAEQDKIFQKFFRVQSKETENIQGTGLGLFIVKMLVEKMNGKIWFESEEGKGTTFAVSFNISL